MAYVKIIYQNSPSTATPINAQNLNHMDDQIALNDQRLTDIETAGVVNTFNSRSGAVVPEKGDYDISQIDAADGQNGYVPVWRNDGTEQSPDWKFKMEPQSGSGTGGHTIVDQDGTSMATENGLQFADSFVSDDSVNGRTVVENIKEHTTASDYENATEDGIHVIDDGNDVPIGEIGVDYEEVEADGVKTYGQLLNELYTKIDTTKLSDASCIYLLTDSGNTHIQQLRTKRSSNAIFEFISPILESVGHLYVHSLTVQQSGSKYVSVDISSSASHTDMSSTIPTSAKFILYYGTSSTVINLKTDANYCQYDENNTVKGAVEVLELVSARNMTISANAGTQIGFGDIPTGYKLVGGIWERLTGSSNAFIVSFYEESGKAYAMIYNFYSTQLAFVANVKAYLVKTARVTSSNL